MGIWRNVVFPRIMDWSMSADLAKQYRPVVLSNVQGRVLEVGFGTGLNLPYYPPHVTHITAFDLNRGMFPLARKRIEASAMGVDYLVLNAEQLAFAAHTFDSVVSTWTLCSIPDIHQALGEIHRVLKPGGRFVFIEHGLSSEPRIQVWQHRLTPLQKRLAEGCHLDRNFQALLEQQPFEIESVEQFYAENAPKIAGYMYQGVAQKR